VTTWPTTAAVDPAVERGRKVVRSQGCLQCHAIRDEKGTPAAIESLAALEQVDLDKGCLAEHPNGRAVDYHLSADQRRLIIAFVRSIRSAPLITAAPTADFYHKVATFGCTNCHELNTLKPADQAERIPMLTNVGARLRKDWIREVLTQKKRVRPWLHRRMPEFGTENVGGMADEAVAVAGVGDAEPLPKPTKEQILTAQRITGIGGEGSLGCVTCHGFNGAKPQVADDTRGPDLNTVASRLRPDHFRRWVFDPKRVNPATPMPSFFEGTPKHDALGTIDMILAYCALGNSMPPPVGWVDENNYTLAVRDRPIVVRAVVPNPNDVWHNFPRGIAVGLPGLVSYCFDADSCMTRYAWSGGFVDMRAAWSGRGGNQIQVMGKRFWATDTAPFHVGGPTDPQPKPQFEGYTLDAQGVPTWLYRIGEVEVKETITATEKGYGIVRKFDVDAHGEPVTLRLVEHPQETAMHCSLPSMESTQLQSDPKKDQKLPALTANLGDGSHITVTVTLTAKEEK
jgi:mono/diheme cytochrome c family protein